MTFDGKSFAKQLPLKPGIYQMFDEAGEVIYVGKAINLKNRVGSYFTGKAKDKKTMALVGAVNSIQFSITRTDGEALILENQLIKTTQTKIQYLAQGW